MSRPGFGHPIELRVRRGGVDELVYQFRTMDEAAEIIAFLGDFFPDADFVLQPLPQ